MQRHSFLLFLTAVAETDNRCREGPWSFRLFDSFGYFRQEQAPALPLFLLFLIIVLASDFRCISE